MRKEISMLLSGSEINMSMPGIDRMETEQKRLWQAFDEIERTLILYLIYATPPVSLDTLSALAKAPAVKVLNFMEKLKKKKIVSEKKEYGKGFYFLNGVTAANFFRKQVEKEEKHEILKNILDYYIQSLDKGPDKTLILAEIYYKLGGTDKGLSHIKNAADILSRSGQKEQAAVYYAYLLNNFSEKGLTGESVGDFLETTLSKLSIDSHTLPVEKQVALLTKAQDIAQKYEKWDFVVRIKLTLFQILKEAGQHEEASQQFNGIWKLAEKIGDQSMLRNAALSISDFLFWEGRVSEAVGRYEEVIGNLEEFGDDETTLKASAMLGWCYVICGRISRGIGMIDAVRSKARSLNFHDAVIYADLMNALSLIEIRKLAAAESFLTQILSMSEETLDHYVSWAANASMTFICCAKKEYEKAFGYLQKAVERSHVPGVARHRGSHIFESMAELEEKGFCHTEMNCDSEIRRMLDGNDIYMKGVALRYRALRNIKTRQSKGRAFLDLRASEKHLKMAGAEIELARTRITLGDAYLKEGEINAALSYLEKAWELFSKIDKDLFPKDLLVIMLPQEQKVEAMLDRIVDINESLGTLQNKPLFLERVINITMDFTMAMRGAFFVVEPGAGPRIIASRNLDPVLVKAEQFKCIRDVVVAATRVGAELIMPGLKSEGAISDKSLKGLGINSLICMPARLGESTYGCLYLDNHLSGFSFPDNQLSYVRLLCSQIAVGLSNIKMYDEMKGLKDRFEDEAIFYKHEMGIVTPTEMIIGKSEGIRHVIGQIRQVAPTDSSVLVVGETGVGKELIAKAIHNLSKRKDGPFIPVNLAALPQELVASELFGHEKGAFTGAHDRQKGRFELANGGTIFLDEIGDLPPSVQVKLLRVLQEGCFERLGSTKQIGSDFRVIAATNKDLHKEVEKGNFRQDLYYRLNVFPVLVPPLRDRKEDIPMLAHHFIDKFSKKMGKKIGRVANEALKGLVDYTWPGNVRELEHFIERAVILSVDGKIHLSGLDDSFVPRITDKGLPVTPLADMERGYIERILNATHWRVSGPNGAASILGLKPTTLISRMKKLGIEKPSVTSFLE
jgi:transcriptional regulator with GAF, ATPase, and Fis domain/tetratricopeptide (TPR) repeat protein